MKLSKIGIFGFTSWHNAKYIQECDDGRRKSPTVHRRVNDVCDTHGPDPRIAQYLSATKTAEGRWSIELVKENVQILENLAGAEILERRVTEKRPMGIAADDKALGHMFRIFTNGAEQRGYTREPAMTLDVVELSEMPQPPRPSAQIIHPAC